MYNLGVDCQKCYFQAINHHHHLSSPPRRKNRLSNTLKMEVIRKKEEGMGNTAIGREMGLAESTVRSIWKSRDAIKKTAKMDGVDAVEGHSSMSNTANILRRRILHHSSTRRRKMFN